MVAAQSATAATRAELVDGLIARVGERDARIAELSAEVERLRRLLSRNSGNSSLPPSSDGVLPGRGTPGRAERRAGAKKKRGKQPGADGTSLAWASSPDQVRGHRPAGPCGCGVDLAGAEVVGVARSHQVHDVPAIEVAVVQHDLLRVRCGCGAVHVADQPAGVPAAPVSYGTGVRTLATYLLVRHHLPVERVAELVADLTGAAVSTGWVHGLLAGAGRAVAPAVEAIAARIEDADVVGFDETTLRVGPAGQGRYVLSASTNLHALFVLGRRDLASFREFLLRRVTGTVVHDRYSLYYHPEFQFDPDTGTGVKDHQACCSHLLRDLEDAREAYPGALWPEQAVAALRGLVHETNTARRTRQAAVPRRPGTGWSASSARPYGSACPRSRPPRRARSSRRPAACWSSCAAARPTCSGSSMTWTCGPRTTPRSAIFVRSRPNRRSPAG